MPKVSKTSAPDAADFGAASERTGQLDNYTVNFVTINESHSLAPMLKGLPGDACHCPHWGYLFAGKIRVGYNDRPDETFEAGDAFYMSPGHVPDAQAGSQFVQFSPKDQLSETMAAIQANMQRMAQGSQ
jgi:hypothetical protein